MMLPTTVNRVRTANEAFSQLADSFRELGYKFIEVTEDGMVWQYPEEWNTVHKYCLQRWDNKVIKM